MAIIDFSSQAGKQLIRNLHAFSWKLYHSLYKSEVNERGKSYTDYVSDAIDKHLRGSDGFDPAKNIPVEYYLKYYKIRTALINDLPPDVKKEYMKWQKHEYADLGAPQILPEPAEEVEIQNPETSVAAMSDDDRKVLFAEIERLINDDDVVKRIYIAIAHNTFNFGDRAEIIEVYKMTENEFDNGRRRFLTILRKAFKNLKLT